MAKPGTALVMGFDQSALDGMASSGCGCVTGIVHGVTLAGVPVPGELY